MFHAYCFLGSVSNGKNEQNGNYANEKADLQHVPSYDGIPADPVSI